MATVTKKFRDDFEVWAAGKVASGDFSITQIEELRALLRIDLADGPDKLREGALAIHDPQQRRKLWTDYFARENAAADGVAA